MNYRLARSHRAQSYKMSKIAAIKIHVYDLAVNVHNNCQIYIKININLCETRFLIVTANVLVWSILRLFLRKLIRSKGCV